jgi:hypothetical protein
MPWMNSAHIIGKVHGAIGLPEELRACSEWGRAHAASLETEAGGHADMASAPLPIDGGRGASHERPAKPFPIPFSIAVTTDGLSLLTTPRRPGNRMGGEPGGFSPTLAAESSVCLAAPYCPVRHADTSSTQRGHARSDQPARAQGVPPADAPSLVPLGASITRIGDILIVGWTGCPIPKILSPRPPPGPPDPGPPFIHGNWARQTQRGVYPAE